LLDDEDDDDNANDASDDDDSDDYNENAENAPLTDASQELRPLAAVGEPGEDVTMSLAGVFDDVFDGSFDITYMEEDQPFDVAMDVDEPCTGALQADDKPTPSSATDGTLDQAWKTVKAFITDSRPFPELEEDLRGILGRAYCAEDWHDACNRVLEPDDDPALTEAALDAIREASSHLTTKITPTPSTDEPKTSPALVQQRILARMQEEIISEPPQTTPTLHSPRILSAPTSAAQRIRQQIESRLPEISTVSVNLAAEPRRRASRFEDPPTDDELESDLANDRARVAYFKRKAALYKSQRNTAREQRDRAETHCVLMRGQMESLQRQINAKKTKQKRDLAVMLATAK
jgi:hypothetical protein